MNQINNILEEIKQVYSNERNEINVLEFNIRKDLEKQISKIDLIDTTKTKFKRKDEHIIYTYTIPVTKINAFDDEGDKIQYIEILVKYIIIKNNEEFKKIITFLEELKIISYMPKKYLFI